jgi:peptidoglycan/xylan/chitin deacetylase (PgdA/CDA1 family)
VFVVTSFVESGDLLSWYGIDRWHDGANADELRSMTWEDAEQLLARGWEVGSHTVTHPLLTGVDDRQLREELTRSRDIIERRLGSCTALAYPYGLADERVAEAARQAGYEVACMLTFAHVVDEPMRRPRIGLESRDQGVRLPLQVSRFGQAARRSFAARAGRRLRRRRTWLPDA